MCVFFLSPFQLIRTLYLFWSWIFLVIFFAKNPIKEKAALVVIYSGRLFPTLFRAIFFSPLPALSRFTHPVALVPVWWTSEKFFFLNFRFFSIFYRKVTDTILGQIRNIFCNHFAFFFVQWKIWHIFDKIFVDRNYEKNQRRLLPNIGEVFGLFDVTGIFKSSPI